MKTEVVMDPATAFPDVNQRPDAAALRTVLGGASPLAEKILENLRAAQPATTTEWHFSRRAGWYQIHLLKKRRLYYLTPRRGDFTVTLVLGGKALALVKQGPCAARVPALLRAAKAVPEGTVFYLDHRMLDPAMMAVLLAAKMTH